MPKLTVLRHTFEEVLKSQKKLRRWIDDLIVENRPLRDSEERDVFIDLLERATLGFGHRFNFKVRFEDGKDMVYFHADAFFTAVAYHREGPLRDDRGESLNVEMSKLWREVRRFCLRVFPSSLDHAASMSPERLPADEFKKKYVGTGKPYDYQTHVGPGDFNE